MGRPLTGLLAAAAAWLGLAAAVPAEDAARLARVHEMYEGYRRSFPDVPEIDPSTLQARLAAGDNLVLVDVRSPEEQKVSMLPGAVPAATVDADLQAWRGRTLVAYCTIGARSGEWAAARRRDGLDVTNLAGSVLAWTHAGGTLVGPVSPAPGPLGPKGITRRVHVYGQRWDLARTDHVAVW